MKFGKIFATPLRRITAIVSLIGIAICIGLLVSLAILVRGDISKRYLDVDSQYAKEYVEEFGASSVTPNKKWELTSNYKKELATARQALDSLKRDNVSCSKIDKVFAERIKRNVFLKANAVEQLDSFYSNCSNRPNYVRLNSLKEQTACYRSCDCEQLDLDFFGYSNSEKTMIRLEDSPFYGSTFDYYYKIELRRAEYQYKLYEVFGFSILLLLFSLGVFEPVFKRIRKTIGRFVGWIKTGD